ncbi:MAG: aminotransferase class V-fold PLP-dependent enzyme [Hyphomicrobiaceae bacterium]|nr:aminotransferase class V-fold PLP-dependent enzyme [Hyphomicrobiaceae bacterium]
MRMKFAETGRARNDLIADIRERKSRDADWRGGRVPLFVFKADDAVDEIGRAAFNEMFAENALGSKRAFLSLGQMEREVVEMALDLFRAPDGAQGFMTTGGTESIVMAVQTARDHARAVRGDKRHRGNLVLPETAHPAFDKAARLMDLEVRRVPVASDFRADPAAMETRTDSDTILMAGSAPCFPFGIIDPIADLSELASRRGLWLHVDACVGGYLAPFVRDIGRNVPDFEMHLPGVASLSADLHKFGYTPKPASTVLYRDGERARHHGFDADVWPNGRFATTTIVGTRPGGAVAGAWAVMSHLGRDGYRRLAGELMAMIDRYRAGVAAIPGLHVIGEPHLSIVAVGSNDLDVFRVAELMAEKGWVPGLTQRPKGLHRMMSLLHAPSLEAYLADLREAVKTVRASRPASAAIRATY